MKTRKMITLLIVGCLVFASCSQVFAIQDESISQKETLDKKIDVVEVSQNFETSELLTDIGVVSYKKALKIDGEVYNLYPTFDDVTGALVNISNQCNGALSAMQELYQLEAFNNATVPEYYEYLPMYTENLADSFDNGTIAENEYEAKMDQISLMESFWDIYENDNSNAEIVKKIADVEKAQAKASLKSVNNNLAQELDELRIMLPYNTGGAEVIEAYKMEVSEPQIQLFAHSGNSKFSVEKGVTYAVKYATSPNTLNYGLLTQDCTNFVSQIKHEGGVPFYKTASDSDGWNLKQNTTGTSVLPKYNYAARWVNADKFVKFFGVKSKYAASSGRYTSFVNFAAAIKKGSFIAYDKEGEGSWNHNAFVTYLFHSGESSRRNITYHGTTYKDFKVAQHTTNYHNWASDSKNGWEELPEKNSKVVFAIVN